MIDLINEIRKKYADFSYDALRDQEKLILLLSYSESGSKAEISAEKISEIYGNLHTAADSDPIFLMKECKISSSSAILLNLISEIKRKSEIDLAIKNRINTVFNAKKFFSAYLRGKNTEYVAAVATDTKFRIKNAAIIAYGGFSEVHVPIRSITDFALKSEGVYIFIAHCHPKESDNPSATDISTTIEISEAIECIGMKLADHIITGIDGAYSLRENKGDIFTTIPDYIIE